MPKFLLRIVSVVLVSGLLMDPALAQSRVQENFFSPSELRSLNPGLFAREALENRAVEYAPLLGAWAKIRASQLVNLGVSAWRAEPREWTGGYLLPRTQANIPASRGEDRLTHPDYTAEPGHPGRAVNFDEIWKTSLRRPIQTALDALGPDSLLRQALHDAVIFEAGDTVQSVLSNLKEMEDLNELAREFVTVLVSHLFEKLAGLVGAGRLLTHLSKQALRSLMKNLGHMSAPDLRSFPEETLFAVRATFKADDSRRNYPHLEWAPQAEVLENYRYSDVPKPGVKISSNEKFRAADLENHRRELNDAFVEAMQIHADTDAHGARPLFIALRNGVDFEVRLTGHDYVEIDMKHGLTPVIVVPLSRIPHEIKKFVRSGNLVRVDYSPEFQLARLQLAAYLASEIEHTRRPGARDPEVEPEAFLRLVEYYGLGNVLKIYANALREQSEFRWRIHEYIGQLFRDHSDAAEKSPKQQADFLRRAGRPYLDHIFSDDLWAKLPNHGALILDPDGASRERLTHPSTPPWIPKESQTASKRNKTATLDMIAIANAHFHAGHHFTWKSLVTAALMGAAAWIPSQNGLPETRVESAVELRRFALRAA